MNLPLGIIKILRQLGLPAWIFGNSVELLPGPANAGFNLTAMNSALAAGGLVQLTIPGKYYTNAPLVMHSKTRVLCAPGVEFVAAAGRRGPLIKSRYNGRLMPAASMVRTSGVVTVTEPAHTVMEGEQVFVNIGPDASFRGLVTVLGVVAGVSWTYASSGSDGAVLVAQGANIWY